MDNCILLSIRKNWAAAILSGEKKLEIRKCAPSYNPNTEKRAEYPLRVVMYETKAHGGAGAVVGFFDCPGFIGTADPADETMAKLSGLSVEQLEEYRDGGAAAAPAWQPLKPGGGISLSNKAPATTKRGWHGLRKQKAPFALDCKRQ